ncbi:hypothetical protein TWF718_005693 [Orbilia javanica]|uniref:Uncharacterized protein n=1 Tax=Orbilia javanica TaxID=47235 RepID=A0AAN8RJL4_9PEZI
MTTSIRRIVEGSKTPITQEQVINMVQFNKPGKKRIVAVLAFELLRTGIDPLYVHQKAASMLDSTNWGSNSGRSLAANLARCYNEGIHRTLDGPSYIRNPHTRSLAAVESSTPPGSPPVSRLGFAAMSSRSVDAMSISGSSLNDDHQHPLDKPLPELPGSYEYIDILDSDFKPATEENSTPLRRPPTIPEEEEEDSASILESSGLSTPKQEDYTNGDNISGRRDELEDNLGLDSGEDEVEEEEVTQRTRLWQLKEVLEELNCDKDYIAMLLTSAHSHGKKADLTYVRLRLY